VIGTLLSSSLAAYAFARLKFRGRKLLFGILLSSMLLPGSVTLLPQFLVFRSLGLIDTLLPLWVPAFLGSAFNIFMLRQFFAGIPVEYEDSARVEGCNPLQTYWHIMLPQTRSVMIVIAIWTFIGAWNNFMGPLIYISSPENMPLSYALQLFNSERGGEPTLRAAFAVMTIAPILAVFLLAQRQIMENTALTGLGGR
jgi:multiple sugar transport system permease protein